MQQTDMTCMDTFDTNNTLFVVGSLQCVRTYQKLLATILAHTFYIERAAEVHAPP